MNPTTTTDYVKVATDLNEAIRLLNHINEEYPRRCGTLVMVSDDTENRIEAVVNEIEALHAQLADLDDATISTFMEDVPGYREFLESIPPCIATNRDEIARARGFLARYYSY